MTCLLRPEIATFRWFTTGLYLYSEGTTESIRSMISTSLTSITTPGKRFCALDWEPHLLHVTPIVQLCVKTPCTFLEGSTGLTICKISSSSTLLPTPGMSSKIAQPAPVQDTSKIDSLTTQNCSLRV